MISLLFKFPFYLLEPLYKFLTSALFKIEHLKIMISWHMSDIWLSYPIFAFFLRNFQCMKSIKGNTYLICHIPKKNNLPKERHIFLAVEYFQLYFYKNLFNPDEKSKVIKYENLNKRTIEVIFNEIF